MAKILNVTVVSAVQAIVWREVDAAMFGFVNNIPIFRRLFYAFLLAAVIPGGVIAILSITFINVQNTRSAAVQVNINAVKSATVVGSYLSDLSEAFNGYASNRTGVRAGTQDLVRRVRRQENQFDTAIKQYQRDYQITTSPQMYDIRSILLDDDPTSILPADQQQALTLVISKLWPDYKTAQEQVISGIQAKAPSDQVQVLLAQARLKYIPLEAGWDKVKQLSEDTSIKVAQVGPSQVDPIIFATFIAFVGTIMVVAVIGYVVNLTITRPLSDLAKLTKRIARGETHARAVPTSHDEISLVANSMNTMLDNIVRLIQETQNGHEMLQAQVEKLVSEVSGVGEGDLRVQAEVTADALGVLADSFNYMVEELGSLVVRVKMVSCEVENSTSSILDRMTQLVETGNAQICQIAEAVVEIEQMATSNSQIAERSQVLHDVARVTRQNAQSGREALQQTVLGMGRIDENVHTTALKVQNLGERSREINEIVDVISSIAHQTNRLALDAAIQAAMAGEDGKGFGAVAADIRRLAERCKDQAGMIARIVRSVRDDIGAVGVSMQDTERETASGTKLTEEAGIALESIFSAVEHLAREVENIYLTATQQLDSSSAVVQIMHGVSDSTQRSGMSTREASQNMQRLARLVEQLRSSVEAFKLREDQAYFVPSSTDRKAIGGKDDLTTFSAVLRMVSATAQPSAQSGSLSNGI